MDGIVEAGDSERMDALMQKIIGSTFNSENEVSDEEKDQTKQQELKAEEAFAFRLFASKPVAKVNIKENDEDAVDKMAEFVAKQQTVDFDQENDSEFIANIQAAAVNYDDILKQSQQPYYAEQYPKRVIHIPSLEQQQQQKQKEAPAGKRKHRKSKKRRDFEKATKEGRIQVKANMRNSATEGGWPGWPGHLTKCHIITTISTNDIKKGFKKNGPLPPLPSFSRGGRARGGFGNRGGGGRGRGSRGGRGGMSR
ncbi:hypothetical protein BDA99DRAFT_437538 [Phascolomyces articulosus]|uniref:Uncharacterized protein n=1 Tax=Phascolomyces articulosus TaxID=60185 RepID=A0AAD5KBN7_9FUNG|nr:hypothetical protein BDA99DRAFT_437538 [Phascolomyces articulosus]